MRISNEHCADIHPGVSRKKRIPGVQDLRRQHAPHAAAGKGPGDPEAVRRGLKKYDVAMYDRGGPRRYVLHRVVEVGDGSYTFLGDNCVTKEKNIPESAIVAVLDSFSRGGKQISVNDPKYRLYVRVHCAFFPIRKAYKKLRARAARVPALRKVWDLIHGRR